MAFKRYLPSIFGIELFSIIQVVQTKPIFDYCKESVPGKSDEIDSSYLHFSKISRKAAFKLAREKYSNIDGLNSPSVPESQVLKTKELISRLGVNMLAQIKDKDPEIFCSGIIKMMRAHTVDSYKAKLEPGLEQYMQQVKANRNNSSSEIQRKN